MTSRFATWSRETAGLYVRYMAVALGSVPFAVGAAWAKRLGWNEHIVVPLALVCGFTTAFPLWKLTGDGQVEPRIAISPLGSWHRRFAIFFLTVFAMLAVLCLYLVWLKRSTPKLLPVVVETTVTGVGNQQFLLLGLFALSLVISVVATFTLRNIANRKGWVSVPQDGFHGHGAPLPRLGGVPIFLAFSVSLIMCFGLSLVFPRPWAGLPSATFLRIYVPACLVLCLGIYDDLLVAGPYLKLAVQAIAATMLWLGGLRILDLPVLFGARQFPWFVSLALTMLWVLGITNAFNLIGRLDGLAAGSALFSTLVVFVVALLSHSSFVALMTVALTGAILGFLRFNFNPATLLLGDSGSLFIGFLLSALALEGAQKAPTLIAVAIPVVSFGLPILETSVSVLRRLIGGRPDREQIHHRLSQIGLSHREVVIVLYAVSGLFALLSLFLLWPTGSTLGLVLAIVGTGIWLAVQHLGYPEFGELRRVDKRTIDQRRVAINNLSFRRATAELSVARDFAQVRRVLITAFENNDFDAFELQLESVTGDEVSLGEASRHFSWSKFPHGVPTYQPSWKLVLDLETTTNQRRGSLVVYRIYSPLPLQLDVGLLMFDFPTVLADALDRALAMAAHGPR
jgi:UDP-GlcNAc:undecaprenyl-phosphate GlcNAc-1-phosphate transferase